MTIIREIIYSVVDTSGYGGLNIFWMVLWRFWVMLYNNKNGFGGAMMDEKRLEFSIFCIESLADTLEIDAKKVYRMIKDSSILDEYIIPCYEPLHSQSKHYIVEDLIGVLKERGALN